MIDIKHDAHSKRRNSVNQIELFQPKPRINITYDVISIFDFGRVELQIWGEFILTPQTIIT